MGNYSVALLFLHTISLLCQQFKKDFPGRLTYSCFLWEINKHSCKKKRRDALPVLTESQSETQQEGCSSLWWNQDWCVEQGSIAVYVLLGILRWNARQSLQHSGSIQKWAAGGWAQKRRRTGSWGSSPASRAKEEKQKQKEKLVKV